MGGSGSGKSTILLLLQGMYKPTAGQILVDGVDIHAAGDESLAAYRSQIAIVDQVCLETIFIRAFVSLYVTLCNFRFPGCQEPKLFDRSIRENIAYAVQPDMPSTDVRFLRVSFC